MFSRSHSTYFLGLALLGLSTLGCQRFQQTCRDAVPALFPPPPVEVPVPNPTHIDPVDPEFLWFQIVDAVDDHFKIQNEQWVRRDSQNILPGKLTTYPQVSGTTFEPWKNDTARGFERLQSTIQTIRRTATVNVMPDETGYTIDVNVLMEKEDVDQAQASTAGSAAQRHDGTIVRNENQQRQLPVTLGWYEIGRDSELERRIMKAILGKISNVEPARKRLLRH